MELNLGRIGTWFSDRLVLDEDIENSIVFKVEQSWCSRIISWIYSPADYSKENSKTIAVFQRFLANAVGENRLSRIAARYGINLDQMQASGSPLLSRDIAKIMTGIQDVTVQDIEELIQAAHAELEEWPEWMGLDLRDALREVENSEGLDKDLFYEVHEALKKTILFHDMLPAFTQEIHGGMPSEALACYHFDSFLADRERLHLCEQIPENDFDSFVHDFSARIIHREMNIGMLVPAPGEKQFYRVSAKIVTGEGQVSYCLMPATPDSDLPPIRFYRGTSARPCALDAMSTVITDLETDLGERAFRSGQQYDQILAETFPPFTVQVGHSLGSTILQKKLVEDESIEIAYLYNGPGITEKEVARYNERIAALDHPPRLIVRDTGADTVSLVGKQHLGYLAPDDSVDYQKYTLPFSFQKLGAGYAHTTIWERETPYYGIENVDRDTMLDRKNLPNSNEFYRAAIGPFLAKVFRLLRDLLRWIFGSRADEQKGIQIGRFVQGHWKIDHIRPH